MSNHNNTTVKKAVRRINKSYFLHPIQRELEWGEERICELFDSITRGMDIGSFNFWLRTREDAENHPKLKFIKNYIDEKDYSDQLTDVEHRNSLLDTTHNHLPDEVSFVMDGQQRLTALYIGLEGSMTTRERYGRREKKDAWTERRLYMNLLCDPMRSLSIQEDRYDFEFKKDPSMSRDEYWFKVGDITDLDQDDLIDIKEDISQEICANTSATMDDVDKKAIHKNLQALHHAINKADTINYKEEDSDDVVHVVTNFHRLNNGGVSLRPEDLTLSTFTTMWAPIDGQTARESVLDFVDEVTGHEADSKSKMSKKFVLKALTGVAMQRPRLQPEQFTSAQIEDMRDIWVQGNLQKAIKQSLDLLESFNLSTQIIASSVVLRGLVFYFYENDNPVLDEGSKSGSEERQRILLFMALMKISGGYKGKDHQVTARLAKTIKNNPGEFPLVEIHESIVGVTNGIGMRPNAEQLQEVIQNGKEDELLLALLYSDGISTGRLSLDVDHIFPEKQLTKGRLLNNHDITESEAERFVANRQHPANKELLPPSVNKSKGDTDGGVWLGTRTDTYFDKHLIPTDSDLHRVEEYDAFLEERSTLLEDRILTIANRCLDNGFEAITDAEGNSMTMDLTPATSDD